MAEIFNFPLPDEDDLYQMDNSELETLLQNLKMKLNQLDKTEPVDMMSEEYEIWGDKHEKLEDLIDIIYETLEG